MRRSFEPGRTFRVCEGSGIDSGKTVTVVSDAAFAREPKVPGWYDSPISRDWIPVRLPDGLLTNFPAHRLL